MAPPLIVQNEQAARALTEPSELRFLRPFMGQDASLSQAAAKASVGLSTMHYRVSKLLRLGLVKIVREERRGGRPVKLYRASAEEFYAPFEVTPYESLEAALREMVGPSDRAFVTSFVAALLAEPIRYSVYVKVQGPGDYIVRLAPSAERDRLRVQQMVKAGDAPPLWISNAEFQLTYEQAKRLQRDLIDLLERYGGQQHPDGKRYLLRLGLAPKHEGAEG